MQYFRFVSLRNNVKIHIWPLCDWKKSKSLPKQFVFNWEHFCPVKCCFRKCLFHLSLRFSPPQLCQTANQTFLWYSERYKPWDWGSPCLKGSRRRTKKFLIKKSEKPNSSSLKNVAIWKCVCIAFKATKMNFYKFCRGNHVVKVFHNQWQLCEKTSSASWREL